MSGPYRDVPVPACGHMDTLRKSRTGLRSAQDASPSQRLLDGTGLLRLQVHCAAHMHHTRMHLDYKLSRPGLLNLENIGSLPGAREFPLIVGKSVYVCTNALVHTCAHMCLWTGRGSVAFIRIYDWKKRRIVILYY